MREERSQRIARGEEELQFMTLTRLDPEAAARVLASPAARRYDLVCLAYNGRAQTQGLASLLFHVV
jgi:hypothetical protein